MRVRVVVIGKLKDAALEGLCDRYLKRLRPLMPVDVIELRSLSALREAWGKTPGIHVVLDERGDQPTTREFAAWIGSKRETGCRQLSFYIGAAEGFSPEDRRAADRLLALSSLTMPHRLARLMLTEQLYRAATVLAGHPYHND